MDRTQDEMFSFSDGFRHCIGGLLVMVYWILRWTWVVVKWAAPRIIEISLLCAFAYWFVKFVVAFSWAVA